MKPGKYYVGDPCYVIEPWEDWLDVFLDQCDNDGVIDKFRGEDCFVAYTMWGDGAYRDTDGRTYLVDAGCIAAIPVEIINMPSDGGNFIAISSEFEPERDDDGTFHIGPVEIKTGYDADDY